MLSKYEKETNVNFNMEDQKATLYTCQTGLMNKLDKLCDLYPEYYKLLQRDQQSKTYELNKELISFRKPRILTPEQKIEFVKRIKKNNAVIE